MSIAPSVPLTRFLPYGEIRPYDKGPPGEAQFAERKLAFQAPLTREDCAVRNLYGGGRRQKAAQQNLKINVDKAVNKGRRLAYIK